MNGSGTTAVVHLVRCQNGLGPFDAFLRSYDAHDAGVDHELVFVFKGFPTPDAYAPYLRRAQGRHAAEVHVADDGFDIQAYRTAASDLPHARLCFLNSFSEILAPGWLAGLSRALDDEHVGAVGASGSWASLRSFSLFLLGLPNGYRGALGERHAVAEVFARTDPRPRPGVLERLAGAVSRLPRDLAAYAPFPAPHLRTNGFLVRRDRFLALSAPGLGTKAGSHQFESGRRGMTAQVRDAGWEVGLVGRYGPIGGPDTWPAADVFWQGGQRELLIADNQTRIYAAATPSAREVLTRQAWGSKGWVG